MSSGRRRKSVAVAALVAAALLVAALLSAGPAAGPAAEGGVWAVTREAFARLWNGALEAFGLRSEAVENGAEPATEDGEDPPAAGPSPAEPKRGSGTDPDG